MPRLSPAAVGLAAWLMLGTVLHWVLRAGWAEATITGAVWALYSGVQTHLSRSGWREQTRATTASQLLVLICIPPAIVGVAALGIGAYGERVTAGLMFLGTGAAAFAAGEWHVHLNARRP